jgi:flavin reductase (DIM6/NTAB) family NADH-FMN oxidoreductase RutF
MDSHTAPTVDVSAFRKAMGSFPTGVTVVTVAYGDGDMHGVTVNSFSSVSLEPMLVLVLACLNETSRAVGLIERAGAFNVNVLSAGQEDVSSRFANRHRPAGPAMFDGVAFEPGITGCPVLVGAAPERTSRWNCESRRGLVRASARRLQPERPHLPQAYAAPPKGLAAWSDQA